MFWSKNKKEKYTPVNPSFIYINVGCMGCSLNGLVFVMLFNFFIIRSSSANNAFPFPESSIAPTQLRFSNFRLYTSSFKYYQANSYCNLVLERKSNR